MLRVLPRHIEHILLETEYAREQRLFHAQVWAAKQAQRQKRADSVRRLIRRLLRRHS